MFERDFSDLMVRLSFSRYWRSRLDAATAGRGEGAQGVLDKCRPRE